MKLGPGFAGIFPFYKRPQKKRLYKDKKITYNRQRKEAKKMYKKRGRKLKKPHKELFEYQYYTLNMSGEEMAKMYEVKPRTIYNWATEYRKKAE